MPVTQTTRQLLILSIVSCATVGLAPFRPLPHVVEKLQLLGQGELSRAIDIADLLFHLTPWLLLSVVGSRALIQLWRRSAESSASSP